MDEATQTVAVDEKPAEATAIAQPDDLPSPDQPTLKKRCAEKRIRELLRERATWKEKAQTLEAELQRLRPLVATVETEERNIPERAAHAVAEGRRIFGAAEFDHVTSQVALSPEAFKALLASPYGPQLLFALGLGTLILNQAVEVNRQQQITKQKLDHYREIHAQHFAGTGAEAIG